MALVVRLVDDKKAVAVAHLIEHGGIGVVAGPDGIEVVPLHHLQVSAHVRDIHNGARDRVGVVPVDTPELDRDPVDLQDISRHADLPDPDLLGDDLALRLQIQGVETGILAGPQVRRLHGDHRFLPEQGLRHFLSGGVHKRRRDRKLPAQVLRPDGDLRPKGFGNTSRGSRAHVFPFPAIRRIFPHTVFCRGGFSAPGLLSLLCFPRDLRVDKIVKQALLRPAHQIDIPENTRHAELVLVLQIAAVAPFEDQDCQEVFTLLQEIRHLELGQGVGHLAVADIDPVQPYIKTGIHTLKLQKGPGCRLRSLKLEAMQIGPAGILMGHIGRVRREGIADIGVLVAVIAVVLPHARDGDLLPLRHVPGLLTLLRQVKGLLQVINAVVIPEFPRSVQHPDAVGRLPALYRILQAAPRRHIIGPVRHRPLVQHRQIFIVFRYDHFFPSWSVSLNLT